MAEHGRQNNVILSGIAELVFEDVFEESVISVLADISVLVKNQNTESCHRFGKPDRDKSQKTIVHIEQKIYKKVLFNKKKLRSIDNSKHNFMQNTEVFAKESLTPMNESIAYNCRKLKCSGLIQGCFLRDCIVRIKC